MATVTLTARYLDQLKSHGKRYEVRRILEKEVLPTWRHRRVADTERRRR